MTSISRRKALQLAGLAASTWLPSIGFAQDKYPSRPVTLIVPQPAGGDADAFCRTLQPKIQEFLGQPLVIDNRGGAAGNIGTSLGARANPDGYTATFVNQGTMALNPHMYPSLGYSLDQFEPVSHLASIDLVICANPSLPAKNLKEFLELAKKNPGKFNYGTAGNGSANHLAGELLAAMAKIDITHIPYRGGGPALTGALAGDIQTVVAFPLAALPMIQSGKLRALAVTGSKRVAALPDVPTVAESGVAGYEFTSWFGIVVPKGTPADVVSKVNAAAVSALKTPQISERLIAGMTQPVGSTPAAFASLIAIEHARWGKVIRQYNIKAD